MSGSSDGGSGTGLDPSVIASQSAASAGSCGGDEPMKAPRMPASASTRLGPNQTRLKGGDAVHGMPGHGAAPSAPSQAARHPKPLGSDLPGIAGPKPGAEASKIPSRKKDLQFTIRWRRQGGQGPPAISLEQGGRESVDRPRHRKLPNQGWQIRIVRKTVPLPPLKGGHQGLGGPGRVVSF